MIDILLILSCVFLPGNLWVLEIMNFILLGVEVFLSIYIFLVFFWDAVTWNKFCPFWSCFYDLLGRSGAMLSIELIIPQLPKQDLPVTHEL